MISGLMMAKSVPEILSRMTVQVGKRPGTTDLKEEPVVPVSPAWCHIG
jgi:hypothetical protein